MTQIEKTLAKFKQNPTTLHFREIETLLLRLGFELIPAKGSHKKFKHATLTADIVVPVHNGDCKDFYKKEIVKILKENNIS